MLRTLLLGGCFMPFAISIRSLIETVTDALREKHGHDLEAKGIRIPSESWVALQFCPKNPLATKALAHTGMLNLQHKLQQRTLRSISIDAHYCNALFKYMKEYGVLLATNIQCGVVFASMDDKAKVSIGEPHLAIALTSRGKASIVPHDDSGTTYNAAGDHDFKRVNFTPSVTLIKEVEPLAPDNADDSVDKAVCSYYHGEPICHSSTCLPECCTCDYQGLRFLAFSSTSAYGRALQCTGQAQLLSCTPRLHRWWTGSQLKTHICAAGPSSLVPSERLRYYGNCADCPDPELGESSRTADVSAKLGSARVCACPRREEMDPDFESAIGKCGGMTAIRKLAEADDKVRSLLANAPEGPAKQVEDLDPLEVPAEDSHGPSERQEAPEGLEVLVEDVDGPEGAVGVVDGPGELQEAPDGPELPVEDGDGPEAPVEDGDGLEGAVEDIDGPEEMDVDDENDPDWEAPADDKVDDVDLENDDESVVEENASPKSGPELQQRPRAATAKTRAAYSKGSFKDTYNASIAKALEVVVGQFSQLQWAGRPIQTHPPATNQA
eukprot:scaffold194114_cov19-Prasinocladus_malaysianus.AAC.1